MKIRRARTSDAAAIHALVSAYAVDGLLLPRPIEEIRKHAGRFLVMVKEEAREGPDGMPIYGCVALEPYGTCLAEVRSLAVVPAHLRAGYGVRLLRAALQSAQKRGFERVFAVTSSPHFFLRHGFTQSSRQSLPEKMARDCHTCSKAPGCRLAAVVMPLRNGRTLLPVLTENTESAVA